MTNELSEDARQLLRRIIESLAWRQLTAIDILGHCLKYVPDLDIKQRVVTELDLNLRLFRDVEELYGDLGWANIAAVVRERASDMPYPGSRIEFGLFYYVSGLAEIAAMQSYEDSVCTEFAGIARSYLHAAPGRPEPTRFVEFASQDTNRPQAQQYLNLWLSVSLRALGRPGTAGDRKAVELGLRKRTVEETLRDFVGRLGEMMERCGLEFPDATVLGIDLDLASLVASTRAD